MEQIIQSLIETEELAGKFYRDLAGAFPDDPGLSKLIRNLARDEEYHLNLMEQALGILHTSAKDASLTPLIEINDAMKKELSGKLKKYSERLIRAEVTKQDLVRFILDLERMEFNELFLYVIKTLKEHSNEFIKAIANIEQHKKSIERFVASNEEYNEVAKEIKKLPSVWNENLLVIDDSEITAELMKALLSGEGNVDVAENGHVALQKLSEKYYCAIVTDMRMPVMDGKEFYKHARGKFPGIGERIVFFTGAGEEDNLEYFRQNNLRYLLKPASIDEIRGAVTDVIDRRENDD